jgi:hypothetical protein
MPESHRNTSDLSGQDRMWELSSTIFFGMVFLFFALGFMFGPNDPDTTTGELLWAIAVTLWFGAMTIGSIGTVANRPWGQYVTETLFGIAALAVQAIFIRHLFAGNASAVSYYATALWIGGSLILYFGDSTKGTSKHNYVECTLWPLLIFLMAPIASLCLFGIPAFFVVGGEWVGAKLQHPHFGAIVGFGVSLILIALVVYWNNREVPEPARQRDGLEARTPDEQSPNAGNN